MLRKLTTAIALVISTLLVLAGVASAKVLPITGLQVATREPVAKSPVRVVLRLSDSTIGGVAVTNGEVVVLPASRTDANGWPLNRTDGKVVVLNRVRDGVFRGSFVVKRAGEYVVLARSSLYAHEAAVQQVQGVTDGLPSPVRLTIAKP